MYFRFCCAIILMVFISLIAILIEKQNLEIRRTISKQYFQKDILQDQYSRLRLATHEHGSPNRIYQKFNPSDKPNSEADKSVSGEKKQKLLLSF